MLDGHEKLGPVELQRVRVYDAYALWLGHGAQNGNEASVYLDSGDIRTGLGECERQRAEPGADLHDALPGPTPDSRAIRRTVFGSMTKFWPRALFGRSPGTPAAGGHPSG